MNTLTYALAIVIPFAVAAPLIVVGSRGSGEHIAVRMTPRTRLDRWLNVFAENHPELYPVLKGFVPGVPIGITLALLTSVWASTMADKDPYYEEAHQTLVATGRAVRSVLQSLSGLFA